jgi:hypothetical protein
MKPSLRPFEVGGRSGLSETQPCHVTLQPGEGCWIVLAEGTPLLRYPTEKEALEAVEMLGCVLNGSA